MSIFHMHKWETLKSDSVDVYARENNGSPYKRFYLIFQRCTVCGKEKIRKTVIRSDG